jgi:hypothetical protein
MMQQWSEGCQSRSHQIPSITTLGSNVELKNKFKKKLDNLSEKERDEIKYFFFWPLRTQSGKWIQSMSLQRFTI